MKSVTLGVCYIYIWLIRSSVKTRWWKSSDQFNVIMFEFFCKYLGLLWNWRKQQLGEGMIGFTRPGMILCSVKQLVGDWCDDEFIRPAVWLCSNVSGKFVITWGCYELHLSSRSVMTLRRNIKSQPVKWLCSNSFVGITTKSCSCYVSNSSSSLVAEDKMIEFFKPVMCLCSVK